MPLLLGLLALIALLFLLSRCGSDDPGTVATTAASPSTPSASGTVASPTVSASDPAATPSPSTSPSASADASGGTGEPGTVVAEGSTVLGGSSPEQLSGHDGEQAVGRAVRVQSVPADEGFWVGTSQDDRIWVQLTGTRGESDYKVKEGDTVDFTGTVTKAAEGFAADAGVTAAEGAAQLTEQGYYVAVPSSSVKLSS